MTVDPKRRFRQFLICMMPSVVMMLLQNAAMIFAAQVYVVKLFSEAGTKAGDDFKSYLLDRLSSANFTVATLLGYSIVGCVIFYLWYRALRRKAPDGAGGSETAVPGDSLKGYPVTLYVGLIVFVISLNYVCQYMVAVLSKAHPEWLEWLEELMSALNLNDTHTWLPAIVYTALLGPICEELCFRGLTLNLTRRIMTPGMANIVQALLFGGMHANPLQSAYAVLVGWLFGRLYLETENLTIVVLAHIAYNSVGIFLERYMLIGDTPFAFFGISFVSMLGTYFGYLLVLKAQQEKEERTGA